MSVISSSPDERKRKPHGRKRDHRGDANGVLEPAPEGSSILRDEIVSIRWAREAVEKAARDVGNNTDPEPADGDDFAELMDDHARSLEHAAAIWRAFRLLWRTKPRRVTSGEVVDCADLFITGRYGSIEDIVAGLLAGKFADIERDEDGFLIGIWD